MRNAGSNKTDAVCKCRLDVRLPASFNYFVLWPGILEDLTIFLNMSILATVLEWTHTLALIKMLAWNLTQSLFIFFNQCIFIWTTIDHIVARNNHVGILTTNWTGSKMMFGCFLIVSGSPFSNTLETECMITSIQNSKLFSICQHWL
jgi:hypothetical protein